MPFVRRTARLRLAPLAARRLLGDVHDMPRSRPLVATLARTTVTETPEAIRTGIGVFPRRRGWSARGPGSGHRGWVVTAQAGSTDGLVDTCAPVLPRRRGSSVGCIAATIAHRLLSAQAGVVRLRDSTLRLRISPRRRGPVVSVSSVRSAHVGGVVRSTQRRSKHRREQVHESVLCFRGRRLAAFAGSGRAWVECRTRS